MSQGPLVAVLIATVHRPEDIAVALDSVLESDYARFEVRIVDQSDGAESLDALGDRIRRPDVHYERWPAGGLASALNRGAVATEAEILAITGDDCTVAPSWIAEMVSAFEAEPAAGVLFGSVLIGPYEKEDGFVPGCVLSERATIAGLDEIHRLSGTTANMGLRRSAWERLGGFDESFGVGADLQSAEDLDLTLRALIAGLRVLQEPRSETTHHSPTLWVDRVATIRRNWYGSGAAFAKALRLRPVAMTRAMIGLLGRWLRGGSEVAATYGPKPNRWSMLRGFGTGFVAGLFRRLDRRTRHFR